MVSRFLRRANKLMVNAVPHAACLSTLHTSYNCTSAAAGREVTVSIVSKQRGRTSGSHIIVSRGQQCV